MATTGDTIYEWDKNPRMPVPARRRSVPRFTTQARG